MDKKILLVLLLGLALATATWTYKGQEFQDNQVVVYITGSQLTAPGSVESFDAGPIPILRSGETVSVPVNGITTPCKLSAFDRDSTATGTMEAGRLINGAQLLEGDYIELADHTRTHSNNWGTNQVVNSLEVGGCAVFWKTGVKMQVNDLSAQNGGVLAPHKTHQRGLDADVPLMCIDGSRHYSCGRQSKFDAETSWIFVKALASTTPVQRIFLRQAMIDKLRQYANIHETNYQLRQAIFARLLAPEERHYTHFHLRFHCSAEDIAAGCIDQRGGFRGTGTIDPIIDDEGSEGAEPPEIASSESTSISFNDDQLLAKADADPNKCLNFDPDLNPIISYCSRKYGVDETLIKAVIIAESGGRCSDKGGRPRDTHVTSGAKGLMQLLPPAIGDINKDRPASEALVWPTDAEKPSKNICGGTQYLAIIWLRYGAAFGISTVEDLVHAYNVGPPGFKNGDRAQAYVDNVKLRYSRLSTGTFPTDPTASGTTLSRTGNIV